MSQENSGVKQQTLFTAVIISFVIGFFAGVVFTAYKTGSDKSMKQSQGADSDHDKAEAMAKALEEEIAKNPGNLQALIQLGNVHFDHGNHQKAITAYEKAIALDPSNANVLTDLGVMYRRNKQPEKAVETFDKAFTADPSHETSRFNKGIVLMYDMDKKEDALKAWANLMEINPLYTTPNGQSLDELIQHFTTHEKTGKTDESKDS